MQKCNNDRKALKREAILTDTARWRHFYAYIWRVLKELSRSGQ